MRADELDYELPKDQIAQTPPEERDGARLLVTQRGSSVREHASILDLPGLLPPALFVFNDTRVLPARVRGQRPSGGQFELLLLERLSAPGSSETWLAMGRPLKSLREGLELKVEPLDIVVGRRVDATTIEVRLTASHGEVGAALEQAGDVPLPPYIARPTSRADRERYQTVFAREAGAVAAPTAGLHFSERLLAALLARGHERAFVTLHVGPGTFAPLAVDDLREHPMHTERYRVPVETCEAIARAKRDGRPVVAVGTTVVRTLESAAARGGLCAGEGATKLCIFPPYSFAVVDALVTNFHLPRSTLLALVMAMLGIAETRAAYQEAVRAGYRFFSYGDAMLVKP